MSHGQSAENLDDTRRRYELADDTGWDELRRLARREEAQDRAAAEKAAIAAFRLRLEERW